MSSWDRHNRTRQSQQKNKELVLWGSAISTTLLFLIIGIGYFFWPQAEPVNLESLAAESVATEPNEEQNTTDKNKNQTSETTTSTFTFTPAQFFNTSEDARQQKLDLLSANIANHSTARFQYAQTVTSKGPQQLKFTVSANGQEHSHAIGLATYANTDIVGAANEWLVRPWWRLGWLPTTVDCGQVGTAAIGGHVSWLDRQGPLYDLGAMQMGDKIDCQAQIGTWYTYEVYEVVQIGYENTRYYWQPPQNRFDAELSLFSCKPELTGIIVVRAKLITE